MLRPSRYRNFAVVAFCAVYLAVQLFNIVSVYFIDDKRFGFQMFAQSSRFKATLSRRLANGQVVETDNGKWRVVTSTGAEIVYDWDDMVRDFRLNDLERRRRAKTGMEVTLNYLEHAVDYVAERIPEDNETEQLILIVTYQKARGPIQQQTIASTPRKIQD